MKILWVVNVVFPDVCSRLGIDSSVAGGWLHSLASDLSKNHNLKFGVATVFEVDAIQRYEINNISYFIVPKDGKSIRRQELWGKIIGDFQPDLVHIHGTEYGYGMDLMSASPDLNYIVSIQGLVSVCYRYYMAGLSFSDIVRNITLRDILRWNTLFHAQYNLFVQGVVEKEYIRRASAIIGRTDWDFAHVKAINRDSKYFFCNETLRDAFYTNEQWSYGGCQKNLIFLSQGNYPIKGVHQVFKAVAMLKDQFPDIHVVVAGTNILKQTSIRDRVRWVGYAKYLYRLLKSLEIESHVTFVGLQQADEMRLLYLRSNVFICPSSIENSPNSLGEAQILGVPSIATYCGGIPFMVKNDLSALLYRFEEYEMLAQHIERVFVDKEFAMALSDAGKRSAKVRHNRQDNGGRLLDIYREILWTKSGGGAL